MVWDFIHHGITEMSNKRLASQQGKLFEET